MDELDAVLAEFTATDGHQGHWYDVQGLAHEVVALRKRVMDLEDALSVWQEGAGFTE